MFTGIIESLGRVLSLNTEGSNFLLYIENPVKFEDVRIGGSISVNGACLTVLEVSDSKGSQSYCFELSKETARRTNLGSIKKGGHVNLERSLKAQGRFDGHIVLGHVDMVVKVLDVSKGSKGDVIFEFEFEDGQYFVDKGSVALNGISLTLSDVRKKTFKTVILPYTFEKTNLKFLKVGDIVNCETDLIGKYVKKFTPGAKESRIDMRFLREHGF